MRPTTDEVLMATAGLWAARGTCPRLQVGCVIARYSRVIASGYNGAPPGLPHCSHDMDAPCPTATHAEANAIAFAARWGVSTADTTIYTTHSPCPVCARLIISAGVTRVVYDIEFRDMTGIGLLLQAGVTCERRMH